jgi:hypothetical protein
MLTLCQSGKEKAGKKKKIAGDRHSNYALYSVIVERIKSRISEWATKP